MLANVAWLGLSSLSVAPEMFVCFCVDVLRTAPGDSVRNFALFDALVLRPALATNVL